MGTIHNAGNQIYFFASESSLPLKFLTGQLNYEAQKGLKLSYTPLNSFTRLEQPSWPFYKTKAS